MDKKNISGFVDKVPVVKMLQITALILFAVGLVYLVAGFPIGHFVNTFGEMQDLQTMLMGVQMFLSVLAQVIYKPMVLLGLAELIKAVREKKK